MRTLSPILPTAEPSPTTDWRHVAQAAAALAAAMGIGRFAYTPILPLMSAQTGLSAHAGANLATANYIGYLAGALVGTGWPRLMRSSRMWRAALILLVGTLAAMPLASTTTEWLILRLAAGFASAVVFVMAVNSMMDLISARDPHRTGWGFAGVGVGIALTGAVVLMLPAPAGWRSAWWASAGLAAMLCATAWTLRHPEHEPSKAPESSATERKPKRPFVALFVCYSLEGVGYIIAGTFLVAAIGHTGPGWLGSGAWLFVGLAAAPSAVLWMWLNRHWSHPTVLVSALGVQAVGIALPAVIPGVPAALIGALLFGVTFIGVSTVALAAGSHLQISRAVALLTAGYSVGQIVGPLMVVPVLSHGSRGFQEALLVGALVVALAAATAGVLRIGYPVVAQGR